MKRGMIMELDMNSDFIFKNKKDFKSSFFCVCISNIKEPNTALVRFLNGNKCFFVNLNDLYTPRHSTSYLNNLFDCGSFVEVQWNDGRENDSIRYPGWWRAKILKKIDNNKYLIEYTEKFKDYVVKETVDALYVRKPTIN